MLQSAETRSGTGLFLAHMFGSMLLIDYRDRRDYRDRHMTIGIVATDGIVTIIAAVAGISAAEWVICCSVAGQWRRLPCTGS